MGARGGGGVDSRWSGMILGTPPIFWWSFVQTRATPGTLRLVIYKLLIYKLYNNTKQYTFRFHTKYYNISVFIYFKQINRQTCSAAISSALMPRLRMWVDDHLLVSTDSELSFTDPFPASFPWHTNTPLLPISLSYTGIIYLSFQSISCTNTSVIHTKHSSTLNTVLH